MHSSLLSRLNSAIGFVVLAAGSLLLATPAAAAYDPSLPYRNYPGFVCHSWGRDGTCLDFSYYEDGYRAPVLPSRYEPYRVDDQYDRPAYRPTYRSVDRVTVRATASRTTVEPGDTLTYTLYIRNNDYSSRSIDVRAFIDPDTSFISASDNGYEVRRDEVSWSRMTIAPNGSRTLTLRTRVDGRYGDTVRLRVQADGDEDAVTTSVTYAYDDYRYRSADRYRRYDPSCDDSSRRYGYSSSYRGSLGYTDGCTDYHRSRDNRYRSDRLSVTVRGSPDPVDVYGYVSYTITLRNDDNTMAYADVSAFLDPDTTFYSVSDGGSRRSGDEVEWRSVPVDRNSTRQLILTARVDTSARDGDTLRMRVRVDGGRETSHTTRVEGGNRSYSDPYYRY
ncbi:MAG: hypothetical protein Greene041619_970 [Candidatus Peregrinibacteria bacterium Greene0416_19]|nr:MAG: hypothetical protein Greene041619_970 [Candidatus Peregrinibacteria bacterium Greene0416_19]